ncbi:MAG: carboxylate-amine ligase [Gammaproteobacteria bacterium]|nr:carboxylate-amine ligase [Gammaproteobacteria bacterium]MDD9882923.1 carboxylate-amine ligase [Gammaproteobacteria bacterium]
MHAAPSFTIGIEEEYMLVEPRTGDLARKVPRSLMPALKKKLGATVSPEFLQSQVEVGTPVCKSVGEACRELAALRAGVAEVAARHDLAIIAASTHPFANPHGQRITRRARYAELAEDLQAVVRRLLIGGMHVHVGIDDDDLRIDLMNQASYILPHLLALSTSSPFWQGMDTGLKSYRLSVWDEMPRTGLPHPFDSFSDFQRHVDVLIDAGMIEDATKIWWDLRPSARYPTLEMRIADLCTTLKDAACVAALFQCWLRMLHRLRLSNLRWRQYSNWLLEENRWRAHRYGIDNALIDFGRGRAVEYAELLGEILALLSDDAEALNCAAEVRHARTILRRGTSAHRQLKIYHHAIKQGRTKEAALATVVNWLRKETLRV